MSKIHVWKIIGVTPLMQNNPASMMNNKDDLTPDKKKYDPKEEAETRCYRDGNHFVHSSIAFRNVLWQAGGGRKIGKHTARVVIASSVMPVELNVILEDKEGSPLTGYDIDSRTVVIQKKNRVMRYRPVYNEWYCKLPFEVDTDIIALGHITDLLNIAGHYFGVGDYRPGKKGMFGKFKAELIK